MTQLYDLLKNGIYDMEREIYLLTWIRPFKTRTFLPLKVNVTANGEKCHFIAHFLKGISVHEGWHRNPDITIYSTKSVLLSLISNLDKRELRSTYNDGLIKIEGETVKGEQILVEVDQWK